MISRRAPSARLSLGEEDRQLLCEGLALLAFYGSRERAARVAQLRKMLEG